MFASFLAMTAFALAPGAGCAPKPRILPESLRGMVLGLHDTDARRSYATDVREIGQLGFNAISVMPIWSQADVHSPVVVAGASTPAQIDEALAIAGELGLMTMVAPIVRLDRTAVGEWRGTLAPPDWAVWFASYRKQMLELAAIAERRRSAILLVGSELCSSELQESAWRALIRDVRSVFTGALAYQANWDHRQSPRFLDALDFVASNGYFEVGRGLVRPTAGALEQQWAPHRAELLAWAKGWGRPLLITEVGYPSIATASAYPWDYTNDSAIDLEAQKVAYQGLFGAWHRQPGLRGLFVYEWWGAGGPLDRGYTPRGKPAERVLRRWLRSRGGRS